MSPFLLPLLVFQDKPAHPGNRPTAAALADTKPVTAREARESFSRLIGLLVKTGTKTLGSPGIVAAERAVTRAEVIAEMARIYRSAESGFRFQPSAVTFDRTLLKIASGQKASLAMLVARGYVGKVSPLAVGPADTLTPQQFGDAVGLFAARIRQVSHLPSPKWTPMLQGND